MPDELTTKLIRVDRRFATIIKLRAIRRHTTVVRVTRQLGRRMDAARRRNLKRKAS